MQETFAETSRCAKKKYAKFERFIEMCAGAQAQSDLDRAARCAGQMAADGALGAVAGAAARVAPAVAKRADEVFAKGAPWTQGTALFKGANRTRAKSLCSRQFFQIL
jgi:hypothetical protein